MDLKEKDKGLYLLLVHLPWEKTLQVGRLGRFPLPRGYYLYTGRARRALMTRLRRHLSQKKRLRWHIDYLLQISRIIEARTFHTFPGGECGLNRAVSGWEGARAVIRGFGSSDCGCLSHLHRFPRRPTLPGDHYGW